MPKYKSLNWISISFDQRKNMPEDTNWIGNVYHGLDASDYEINLNKDGEYFAYLGRIIEPKGVHLAIAAAKKAGVKLKIAGKHYGSSEKNKYWEEKILPELNEDIEYVGFISKEKNKNEFLKNAKALIVPSTFDEPFGMVMIEALASGTPVIGLDSGAISEVVKEAENGFLVRKETKKLKDKKTKKEVEILNEDQSIHDISIAMKNIVQIDREFCRKDFEERFTLRRMALDYRYIYSKAISI
jgi:glycosyltransferase involved in cell wall biosynthesis